MKGFQICRVQAVAENHRRQEQRRVALAGGIERANQKKTFALHQRSLRITVDHQDFEFVLRFESKIGERIAGEAIFFQHHLAVVRARLIYSGLKAHRGFALGRHGGEFLFLVLAVDAQLHQQIFDFTVAEIRQRRFNLYRQIDADALAAQAHVLHAAVERLLLAADADQFQWDRWIDLFQGRDGKLLPAGEAHVGDEADFLLSHRLVQ